MRVLCSPCTNLRAEMREALELCVTLADAGAREADHRSFNAPSAFESITEDVLDVIASMIDLRLGQIAVVRAENAIQYFIAAVLRQTSNRRNMQQDGCS